MENQTSPIVTQILLKIENLIKTLEGMKPAIEERRAHSAGTPSRSDQVQPVNETTTTPDSPLLTTPTGQALSESSESIILHSDQPLQLQDDVSSEPNFRASNRVPRVEVPNLFATDFSSIFVLNDAEISEESLETKLCVSNTISNSCLLPVCGNASVYFHSFLLEHMEDDITEEGGKFDSEPSIVAQKNSENFCIQDARQNGSKVMILYLPPAKPPDDGCIKGFDCIKFDSSAILDIKSLSWAFIVGVLVHYDGLFVRLKLMGKLENITIFLKKRQDDAEGLLKFKTGNNLNVLRKVGCDGNMMYELLSVDHVACLRNLDAEYSSTFLVKSAVGCTAAVVNEEHVGVTDLIKSWPSVFMKPPARPPDKSLKILHGLISHTNFKLLGILYKHDILYDLHGGLIPMTTSIRGVKFRKRSILCVCESKLVCISGYCNLLDRDLVLFFLTHKLSNKLGLEHALNFLHEVMKHLLLVGSKLGFAKACDAFVELENICGYLAAAMSAVKGPIRKHPHISGTEWGATCTAFCDELVDSVDQVSSNLAETNSDLELNDLLQSVEPHVCLMRHARLYISSVLNIESFNKGFGDENSKESSILEVMSIVFDSHPGLRHEKLSHEVFQ
ncbi:hypothetical protein QQ045_010711 [Rhodiola kirilowii]